MKIKLMAVGAVVSAVALCAFTTNIYKIRYYVTHEDAVSYTISADERVSDCQDGDKLCSFVYTGTDTLSSPLPLQVYNTLRSQDKIQDESFFRR